MQNLNTIKLVRYYSGVDGLKTGYTKSAGYCITTTAYKNNMRLISVVMGEPSSKIRNNETISLLDYGFNTYRMDKIISKDKVIDKIKISLGKKTEAKVVSKKDINILNSKTKQKRNITYKVKLNKIKAPLKSGDKVGTIEIIENNKVIMTSDATIKENIKKASIITVYLRNILDIAKGNFN